MLPKTDASTAAIEPRDRNVLVITGTRRGREDAVTWFCWWIDTYGMPSRVIVGCARGIDRQAVEFFESIGVEVTVHRAKWWPVDGAGQVRFNAAAGPERNQAMVDDAPDDARLLALPWWDSAGTWDCVRRASARGLCRDIKMPDRGPFDFDEAA